MDSGNTRLGVGNVDSFKVKRLEKIKTEKTARR